MRVRGAGPRPGRESLSEATFEQVLARAADVDDRASSRLDVARAREIALDPGVIPGHGTRRLPTTSATGKSAVSAHRSPRCKPGVIC